MVTIVDEFVLVLNQEYSLSEDVVFEIARVTDDIPELEIFREGNWSSSTILGPLCSAPKPRNTPRIGSTTSQLFVFLASWASSSQWSGKRSNLYSTGHRLRSRSAPKSPTANGRARTYGRHRPLVGYNQHECAHFADARGGALRPQL